MADLGKLFTLGGAVAGGIMGGPAGIATGASLGQMAGGMLTPEQKQKQSGQLPTDTAMARRMEARNMDAFEGLRQGAMSMYQPGVPDEVKAQVARPLMSAYMSAAKQKGINNPFEGFPEVKG